MKTINKYILGIEILLGITLLAFTLMGKFPEYYKLFTSIPSAVAAGIGLGNGLLVNESNKNRSKVLWLLMGAFVTFAGMVIIAKGYVIDKLVYLGIVSVMASLFISAIAYNVGNVAEKRKAKKTSKPEANK